MKRIAERTKKNLLPLHAIAASDLDKDPTTLEGSIVKLALGGQLRKATRKVLTAQPKRGIAITFKRGRQIIKRYPDGHTEILGEVQRVPYTLPKGVKILSHP